MSMRGHALWEKIDYEDVREFYDKRTGTHSKLIKALRQGEVPNFVSLALGMDDRTGNYSASDHWLVPKILACSRPEIVFELAGELLKCKSPEKIPEVIYKANIPYLKISVGSEMALMLRPGECWVTNVRTLFVHLVLKHGGNIIGAKEELDLYRQQDIDSEMDYKIWPSLHRDVGPSLTRLAAIGDTEAKKQHVKPGDLKYLWADAVADQFYGRYHKS